VERKTLSRDRFELARLVYRVVDDLRHMCAQMLRDPGSVLPTSPEATEAKPGDSVQETLLVLNAAERVWAAARNRCARQLDVRPEDFSARDEQHEFTRLVRLVVERLNTMCAAVLENGPTYRDLAQDAKQQKIAEQGSVRARTFGLPGGR